MGREDGDVRSEKTGREDREVRREKMGAGEREGNGVILY